MTKTSYVFKTATNSDPIDISWSEAQEWCNFVLFKPTWLPDRLIEISNKIRPESLKKNLRIDQNLVREADHYP